MVLPDLGDRRSGSRLDQLGPDLDLSSRLVGVHTADVRDLNVHCPIADDFVDGLKSDAAQCHLNGILGRGTVQMNGQCGALLAAGHGPDDRLVKQHILQRIGSNSGILGDPFLFRGRNCVVTAGESTGTPESP